MAHSWLNLAAKLGFELRIATPKAYQINKEILEKALEDAKVSGAKITVGFDPKEAVKMLQLLQLTHGYQWVKKLKKNMRIKEFRGFIVDEDLMKLASKKQFSFYTVYLLIEIMKLVKLFLKDHKVEF